jgi:ribonuclease BN (tRNA processing enzyme)
MEVTFLGTRGEIEETSPTHKLHSGILLEADQTRVLLDLGEASFLETSPDAVIITHAHPDHFSKELKGKEISIPVYSTAGILTLLDTNFKVNLKERRPVKGPFSIGSLSFDYRDTLHSLKTPSIAIRAEHSGKAVVYSSDVIHIYGRKGLLSNSDLYIGDASTLTRGLIRRDKKTKEVYGHTGVGTQITWCLEDGVKKIVFTHLGSEAVKAGDKELEEFFNNLCKEKAEKKSLSPIPVLVAKDGMKVEV